MVGLHQSRAPEPFADDLVRISDLAAERPAWMRDALCLEFPDVDWFPERGQPFEPAKQICRRCLCQAECLDYATERGIGVGIWGGSSGRERRELLRIRARAVELDAWADPFATLGKG